MSNVLKPLVFSKSLTAQSPSYEYRIRKDSESKDKYMVTFLEFNANHDEPAKEPARGFATIDEAEKFVQGTHYPHTMQPYINEPTLVDAVNTLVDACHGAAVKGGWWHDISTGEPLERNTGELLMLMVSEIAEAMEGDRKGLKDDHLPQFDMLDVEIADTLIRIFDFIGGKRLDSAIALDEKLKYNAKRADHKIENRIKDGGKKY